MIILTIRTDKPESEIGLYDDDKQSAYYKWEAHRKLAETIHTKTEELLSLQGVTLQEIEGIVIYEGPGSFTGLRIGMSVANAMAYSLGIKIVASSGKDWINLGIERITSGQTDEVVVPEYGQPVHTTIQRK